MKKFFSLFVFLLIALFATATIAGAGSQSVRGYTRKNGTYVSPHKRSSPDRSKHNNWSTKGNTNPYTGKKGTKSPYK